MPETNIVQWEYLQVYSEGTFNTRWDNMDFIEFLNDKGKAGWELCSMNRGVWCIFKRAKLKEH